MQHLEAERLAALDHDAPTSDELAHLAACAMCRAEWDAYGSLRTMAQESATHDVPDSARLTSWDSLSRALRSEGLLTSTFDITPLQTPLVVRPLHGASVHATAGATAGTSVVESDDATAGASTGSRAYGTGSPTAVANASRNRRGAAPGRRNFAL
ncbi:MAG TPA: hypothetical protein VE869_13300, partial [Gemmatimonas sp.]|nr:hypothetical protein [Gemmatimonas sp.]